MAPPPKPRPIPPPAPEGARYIALTRGAFVLVDEADYGWLSKFTWRLHVSHSGTRYAARQAGRRTVFMHREILGVGAHTYDNEVDHENRDGLDCRRHNLRRATRAQNRMNSSVRRDSASGVRGVRRANQQQEAWVAYFKGKHLGTFHTFAGACNARFAAELAHYGAFAPREA